MDPLSALSVAGVTVQFVDFSSKLFSRIWEIYHSAKADEGNFRDLQVVTERLLSVNHHLESILSPDKLHRHLTSAEQGIALLCKDCGRMAEKSLKVLQELTPDWTSDQKKSVWDNIRKAFHAVWKKREIEELQRRLDQFRQQLMMEILILLQ